MQSLSTIDEIRQSPEYLRNLETAANAPAKRRIRQHAECIDDIYADCDNVDLDDPDEFLDDGLDDDIGYVMEWEQSCY